MDRRTRPYHQRHQPPRPMEAPITVRLVVDGDHFEYPMPDPELGLISFMECVRRVLAADVDRVPWMLEVRERGRPEGLRFGTDGDELVDPIVIQRGVGDVEH